MTPLTRSSGSSPSVSLVALLVGAVVPGPTGVMSAPLGHDSTDHPPAASPDGHRCADPAPDSPPACTPAGAGPPGAVADGDGLPELAGSDDADEDHRAGATAGRERRKRVCGEADDPDDRHPVGDDRPAEDEDEPSDALRPEDKPVPEEDARPEDKAPPGPDTPSGDGAPSGDDGRDDHHEGAGSEGDGLTAAPASAADPTTPVGRPAPASTTDPSTPAPTRRLPGNGATSTAPRSTDGAVSTEPPVPPAGSGPTRSAPAPQPPARATPGRHSTSVVTSDGRLGVVGSLAAVEVAPFTLPAAAAVAVAGLLLAQSRVHRRALTKADGARRRRRRRFE